MSHLAGYPPKHDRSWWPPLAQVAMALSALGLAWWAERHAPTVIATDQWFYHALAVCLLLFGVLWLPFALVAVGRVARNRRRGLEIIRR